MAIVADPLATAGGSIRWVPRPQISADGLTKAESAKANGALEHYHISNSDRDPLQSRLATSSPDQGRKSLTTHWRIQPTRWWQRSVQLAPCRQKHVGWRRRSRGPLATHE